jgi:hypothetical protein
MTISQSQSPINSVDELHDQRQARINTSIPAVIESYDPAKKRANIRVTIADIYETDGGGEVNLDWPIIPNVPVQFLRGQTPSGKKFSFTWPLAKGVPGMLHFSQRDISEFIAGNGMVAIQPDFTALHDEGDAVFVPGLFLDGNNDGTADNDHVWIEFDGTIKIKAKKVEVGETGNAVALAKAQQTDDNDNTLKTNLNLLLPLLGIPPIVLLPSTACNKAFGG